MPEESGSDRFAIVSQPKQKEQFTDEHEIRLARIIANTIAQLDGVPTEVEIENGYAYIKRKGAEYRTKYVLPPEAYVDIGLSEEYGRPVFAIELLIPVDEEPSRP